MKLGSILGALQTERRGRPVNAFALLPGKEFVDKRGAGLWMLEHPEMPAARYQLEPRAGDLASEQVSVLYGDERVLCAAEHERRRGDTM